MKKLFIVLICLSVGVLSAQAQTPQHDGDQKSAKIDKHAPRFKWIGGDTYDFGNVPEGPIAEHKFEFENVGKEPLIISTASASCGCTTPEWPKEPILPRHKAVITVRYNTQGRVGNINKQVYVQSNSPADNGRATLNIKGTVIAASNQPPAKG